MITVDATVVVRGGGDIASGTIQRLHRCGFRVLVLELAEPLVVRRKTAFAQAVTDGAVIVEDTRAVLIDTAEDAVGIWQRGDVPLLIDPGARSIDIIKPDVVVDATLAKRNIGTCRTMAPITIGLGPGLSAGIDVDVVVETLEGHSLGSLIFEGAARADTGVSVPIMGYAEERVLRAPCSGYIQTIAEIGDVVKKGDVIANVDAKPITAEIGGVVHGLIQEGMYVSHGLKVGDIDPRAVRSYCYTIFDKARAVAGGVLEAILLCSRRRSCCGNETLCGRSSQAAV